MNAENLKTNILNSINQQDYMKALEYYLLYENAGYVFDDSVAIFGGSIFHYLVKEITNGKLFEKVLNIILPIMNYMLCLVITI